MICMVSEFQLCIILLNSIFKIGIRSDSTCDPLAPSSILGSGRSCLGNCMDRGAWQGTVRGVTKNQTQLSDQAHFDDRGHEMPWIFKLSYI